MNKIPCVVIGGGVVGLSCARSMGLLGISTILIEKNSSIGQETSSRNSEVIHSGIYYPSKTLKFKLCTQGRELLYKYIKDRNISYNQCGKLIIATNKQQQIKLHQIYNNGITNGLLDLKLVSKEYIHSIEPLVDCIEGIESPYTGIFDSHTYMINLLTDCESNNVDVLYDCTVESIDQSIDYNSQFVVTTSQGPIECDYLINACGLHSIQLSHHIQQLNKIYIPKAYYAKGNYYKLNINNQLFNRLIYPTPVDGGLGIHSTIDLNGSVRFGPDVEWLKENDSYEFINTVPNDYSINNSNIDSFYKYIREYYPSLPDASLIPDYAGIRPKLRGPVGCADISTVPFNVDDFYIQDHKTHQVNGLVNLFGIESPGLTSSLAIGDYVSKLILS